MSSSQDFKGAQDNAAAAFANVSLPSYGPNLSRLSCPAVAASGLSSASSSSAPPGAQLNAADAAGGVFSLNLCGTSSQVRRSSRMSARAGLNQLGGSGDNDTDEAGRGSQDRSAALVPPASLLPGGPPQLHQFPPLQPPASLHGRPGLVAASASEVSRTKWAAYVAALPMDRQLLLFDLSPALGIALITRRPHAAPLASFARYQAEGQVGGAAERIASSSAPRSISSWTHLWDAWVGYESRMAGVFGPSVAPFFAKTRDRLVCWMASGFQASAVAAYLEEARAAAAVGRGPPAFGETGRFPQAFATLSINACTSLAAAKARRQGGQFATPRRVSGFERNSKRVRRDFPTGQRDLLPRDVFDSVISKRLCAAFNRGSCGALGTDGQPVAPNGSHDYKSSKGVVSHVKHSCVMCGSGDHGFVGCSASSAGRSSSSSDRSEERVVVPTVTIAPSLLFRTSVAPDVRRAEAASVSSELVSSFGLRWSGEPVQGGPDRLQVLNATGSPDFFPLPAARAAQIEAILADLWCCIDPLFLDLAVDGLVYGANLCFNGDRDRTLIVPSYASATGQHEFVQAQLDSEIAKGWLAGWFSSPPFPAFRSPPLGTVAKDGGSDLRIIVDSSAGGEGSLNGGSAPLFSTFPSWPRVCNTIYRAHSAARGDTGGKRAWMIKFDVEAAFRQIPIRPQDWPLCVLHWAERHLVYMWIF
eukprot:g56453.t1